MTWSNTELARRRGGQIEIRPMPLRLEWLIDDLASADGHRLCCRFECSGRALPQASERKLLEEIFLGQAEQVTTQAAAAHVQPRLRGAAVALAAASTAAAALQPDTRATWLGELRRAAEAVAFACGIELLAPFELDLTSPTLDQQHLAQAQRAANQRRAAEQLEHFQYAAQLLRQWHSAQAACPGLSPGRLLEQINPADRGPMLQNLLRAGPGASPAAPPRAWAVSGPCLIGIDLSQDPPTQSMMPLPTEVGPLRSVQMDDLGDQRCLIAGARNGLLLIDPAQLSQASIYCDKNISSEHGFARACIAGRQLWGCHRDGGLVGWSVDHPGEPLRTLRPADLGGSPRFLCRLSHAPPTLAWATDTTLWVLAEGGAPRPVASSLPLPAGLLAMDSFLLWIGQDGSLHRFDPRTLEKMSERSTGGPVACAALLPWLGTWRLLLAREQGPIDCIGLDDSLVSQYLGPYRGLRSVVASEATVAAVSPDRQRLIYWPPWDGRRPVAEIHLTALSRHRVAEVTV